MAAGTETVSLEDSGAPREVPTAYLVLALEGARPQAGSVRYSLAGVNEVRIGRGAQRSARREGGALVIEIPDSSLSSQHVRMTSGSEGWTLEDAGSKNGTYVDGHRATRRTLDDGDVIDAGRTVLVFADPGGTTDPGDLELGIDGDVLDTFEPLLAARATTLMRVALSTVPVLLMGETGTGKELVARAVHQRSGRSGTCVAVNCGALPPTLVESELFGYKRGAFSGANQDRPGLIRTADRGTLFLDEIGELSASAQAALLRALQEREVLPVGSETPVKVDFRGVSATCQDLPALVALDRFRRDLFARIAGFTMILPPLRARRVDVGLLVARLLARQAGSKSPHLERTAARALFLHDWPQNIRELEQALATALAVADGDLGLGDLPEPVRAPPARPAADEAPRKLDRAELEALLRTHKGNVSHVAAALATSRSQVRRLCARYGLVPEEFRD